MTTSETSPSVHLQCLKSCLPEKVLGNNPSDTSVKDIISSSSDPKKSPTNNNNNNNNTTTSNSNNAHLNHSCTHNTGISGGGSNNTPGLGFSSLPASTVHGSSPTANNSSTPIFHSCCYPVTTTVGCNNKGCATTTEPVEVTSGAESTSIATNTTEVYSGESDPSEVKGECTGESNSTNSTSYKISENHLSTKLLRNKSSPYPVPNSGKGVVVVSTHVKQNQDKSNHSQVNPLAPENLSSSTSSGSFIALTENEDQVMFDNVPVNSIQTNHHQQHSTSIGIQGGSINNSSENCSHNNPNLMAATSLLTSGGGINSNGMIHANNMLMKQEPNGNNIDLTAAALDNQFRHQNNHHNLMQQSFQLQQHHSNGGDSCGANNQSHSPMAIGGDNNCGVQGHETFLRSHNNSNENNQLCHNGLFVNSCVHNCGGMSLVTGNGSIGSISGNSNGAGSMTSPGGSLDEHDCDDDKVINGDTFATEDLPDPDAIKMFVGQVPKHLNESELRTLFEEFGRVFQINVLRDKATKQSKGCCFVTFYTRKSALDAQNALHNVKTLPGMNHPIQMKPADNENRYERKLFVGMLSKKYIESDVRTMFQKFGVIDECTVLRDAIGQSRGCAFVTFASKQSAQNAIKAVHQSTTMEGCASPIVVKFADTQKDKDQKRQHNIQTTITGNISNAPLGAALSQPYISGLLKLEQILHQYQQQQQQQQPQQTGYFSQLSPLGVQGNGGFNSFGSGSASGGLLGLSSPQTSTDFALAALALANMTSNPNQHPLSVGVQNFATLLGNHSSLSPTEFTYSGANGCSLGSTNALAITGNGLHQTGLSSFSSAIRSQPTASKQNEGPEGANLFIYHLPPECSDAELAQMFLTYGNVISAKVFVDKQTNLSKCFGFVSFDNPLSAQLAIQSMNGFQIGMKRLKVQLKRSKEAAKPY